MTFERIAQELKCSEPTVRRAYDYAHPEALHEAAAVGRPPNRGRNSRLGAKVHADIREMLREGKSTKQIMAKVGCSRSTVARHRQNKEAASGRDQSV